MGEQPSAHRNRRALRRGEVNQPPSIPQRALDLSIIMARWVLGAIFIYLGLQKALHPSDFLKLVRQYDMVHNPVLLNSIASALPWFEIFLGLMLLLGLAVRGTALAVVALLIPFTILVWHRALLLHTARSIPFCAVKFDCGCGAGEEFICGKLAQNAVLILLSCSLLWGRGRRWCARYSIWPISRDVGQNRVSGETS